MVNILTTSTAPSVLSEFLHSHFIRRFPVLCALIHRYPAICSPPQAPVSQFVGVLDVPVRQRVLARQEAVSADEADMRQVRVRSATRSVNCFSATDRSRTHVRFTHMRTHTHVHTHTDTHTHTPEVFSHLQSLGEAHGTLGAAHALCVVLVVDVVAQHARRQPLTPADLTHVLQILQSNRKALNTRQRTDGANATVVTNDERCSNMLSKAESSTFSC